MFVNYAHRGASEYAPENTMAAFYLGLEMGANGIETDVQETADGKLVLFHDNTLKRITGHDGTIRENAYSKLMRMDFGAYKGEKYRNEKIPLLEDFLKYFSCKDLTFAIELKCDHIEMKVLHLLKNFNCLDKSIITSFSAEHLKNIRKADKTVRLGYLTRSVAQETVDMLAVEQINQYCPEIASATPEIIRYAKAKGLSIRFWGIKTVADMHSALEFECDGMTVNFPDKLAEAVGAQKIIA